MMLPEYEGKKILRSIGIRVPAGFIVQSGDTLLRDIQSHSLEYPVAVKAQIESGGRGKAGGVLRADNEQELVASCSRLLRTQIQGLIPRAILVEPWMKIDRELYLSVVVDGASEGYAVLYSATGGIRVEEDAELVKYAIGAPWRFRAHKFRALLENSESDFQVREKVVVFSQRLVSAAACHDATTIEINPLAVLPDGELVALDAKVVLDQWAAFRNQSIFELKEDQKKREPKLLQDCLDMQHMYVRLDGDIGLISGGAGMTMAAMDLIQKFGGSPACFLDCSPGPTSTRGYRPAFAMLDADPQVRVILVSIYGGGTQMQRVAHAMKEIMKERKSKKPVVFRLNGTNVDQVPKIFAEFGAINHARLEDAVTAAIELTRGLDEHTS
jgi:succinyl-CoA synthetase beta subunit